MILKDFEPSDKLRHIVKNYVLLHFEFDRYKPVPVKPFPVRPVQSLVFYLKGGVRCFDPETGQFKTFPKMAINGAQTKRFDFHVEPQQFMLSVDFQHGGLSKFLQMPLKEEFLNERIDAEALLNPDIGRVYEQMQHATSYQQIIDLVEDYLWQKIQKQRMLINLLERVSLLLSHQSRVPSVEYLADQACLSLGQFERRFKRQMGISPKFFLRAQRFNQAFMLKEQNPSLDWLSIALQTGYNDYQHMAKDFKQFAGTTPNSLLQAQANAPERILGLVEFWV
ncbi:MAG: helix-turn-helix domain-containing protein [Spirosomataceae bacterium]